MTLPDGRSPDQHALPGEPAALQAALREAQAALALQHDFGDAVSVATDARVDPRFDPVVDGPAQLHRQRCAHFLRAPPADEWDGVRVLTSK